MWKFSNKAKVDSVPEDAFGFVYGIYNITKDKNYIGCKQIKQRRWVEVAKSTYEKQKQIDKTLVRKNKNKTLSTPNNVVWRYKVYREKESDWQNYTGSNKELNADIKNGDEIHKVIYQIAYSKKELTYLETKYLFSFGVLEKEDYYNDNILGKFYKSDFITKEEV